jgi:hypothetical protein
MSKFTEDAGDTKTIEQALVDSQKDSNLYKYFALNSMRLMNVMAVAIQVNAQFHLKKFKSIYRLMAYSRVYPFIARFILDFICFKSYGHNHVHA